jgi:hypothetical protein
MSVLGIRRSRKFCLIHPPVVGTGTDFQDGIRVAKSGSLK